MRQDENMILKKTWSGRKKRIGKTRPQSIWDGVSYESAIRPPFPGLMMNRIVHLPSSFQASLHVPRHALSRTSNRGWTSALSLWWLKSNQPFDLISLSTLSQTVSMLDLVFAGWKASIYGWKFVFLVLYIGQVAVPTLSLSALCEWAFSKRRLRNRRDGRGWSTAGLWAASDDALWGQDLPIMRHMNNTPGKELDLLWGLQLGPHALKGVLYEVVKKSRPSVHCPFWALALSKMNCRGRNLCRKELEVTWRLHLWIYRCVEQDYGIQCLSIIWH